MFKFVAVGAIALVFALSACGGAGDVHDGEHGGELFRGEPDQVVHMEISDFAYTPSRISITQGEFVQFQVHSETSTPHDFTIDDINADLEVVTVPTGTAGEGAGHDGEHGGMSDLHFAFLDSGHGVINLRVHEAGEYVYYCSIPGHQDMGMQGILSVGHDGGHDD